MATRPGAAAIVLAHVATNARLAMLSSADEFAAVEPDWNRLALAEATPSTVVDLKGESHYAETAEDLPQVYRDVAAAWNRCLEEGADFSGMNRALRERDTPDSLATLKAEVAELCAKFPPYPDGV